MSIPVVVVGVVFLHDGAGGCFYPLFGFGITSNYLLKVIGFNNSNNKTPTIEYSNIDKENNKNIENNVDEQMDVDIIPQIEMERTGLMKQRSRIGSISIPLNFQNSTPL
eukprot:330525_1